MFASAFKGSAFKGSAIVGSETSETWESLEPVFLTSSDGDFVAEGSTASLLVFVGVAKGRGVAVRTTVVGVFSTVGDGVGVKVLVSVGVEVLSGAGVLVATS